MVQIAAWDDTEGVMVEAALRDVRIGTGVGHSRLRCPVFTYNRGRADMYAALVRLKIDPDQAPEAAAAFTSEILPKVLSADGFHRGYWLDPVDGKGFGFVLFETEEQARLATPPASDWPAPGVEILSVDVQRVAVDLPASG